MSITKTLNLLIWKGYDSTRSSIFDCDGTLVDSEVICSRAYVHMFQEFGITLDLAEIFKRFKGVKLYEIIDTINAEYGVNLQRPPRSRFTGRRSLACSIASWR